MMVEGHWCNVVYVKLSFGPMLMWPWDCAGKKGYWAVIFFQQVASIGNNLTIQIVAGISLKVR
jgi:hypothetical protein